MNLLPNVGKQIISAAKPACRFSARGRGRRNRSRTLPAAKVLVCGYSWGWFGRGSTPAGTDVVCSQGVWNFHHGSRRRRWGWGCRGRFGIWCAPRISAPRVDGRRGDVGCDGRRRYGGSLLFGRRWRRWVEIEGRLHLIVGRGLRHRWRRCRCGSGRGRRQAKQIIRRR